MLLYLRYKNGLRWVNGILNKIPEVKLDPEIVGEVDSVSIKFVIDFFPLNEKFKGEAGVSYFVSADGYNVMFDTGFNSKNKEPSPLLHNAELMGIRLPSDIDSIVISHMHLDHIGGIENQLKKTFSLSKNDLDLSGIPAFVPVKMTHPTADVIVNQTPTILHKGIFISEPLPSMLYFMGRTPEQALIVNIKNKGLVVIVGCGHQKVQNLVNYLERLIPIPVYAVIGGVHLPVTQSREVRLGIPMQKFLGTGKPPWSPPSKHDVEELMKFLKMKNVVKVGISAHDSCDYTIDRFREEWKENFIEVRAGAEVVL